MLALKKAQTIWSKEEMIASAKVQRCIKTIAFQIGWKRFQFESKVLNENLMRRFHTFFEQYYTFHSPCVNQIFLYKFSRLVVRRNI